MKLYLFVLLIVFQSCNIKVDQNDLYKKGLFKYTSDSKNLELYSPIYSGNFFNDTIITPNITISGFLNMNGKNIILTDNNFDSLIFNLSKKSVQIKRSKYIIKQYKKEISTFLYYSCDTQFTYENDTITKVTFHNIFKYGDGKIGNLTFFFSKKNIIIGSHASFFDFYFKKYIISNYMGEIFFDRSNFQKIYFK